MKTKVRSLRARLLRTILLPVLLLIVSIIVLMLVRGGQMIREGSINRGMAIVSFLAPAAEYGFISGNERSLGELLQAVMEQPGVTAVLLQDEEARTIAVRGQPRFTDRLSLEQVGKAQLLHDAGRYKSFAAAVMSPEIEVDELAVRAESGNQLRLGWVYVEIDTGENLQQLGAVALASSGFALLILLLTGGVALRLANQVSEPLEALADGVARIASGEREVQVVTAVASAELHGLQQGFNQMARALDQAHDEMQAKIDQATSQLAHQATHDMLTGLPNRRAFEEALRSALEASHRASDQAVLCLIDLDGFKFINDTAGHAAGDEALRQVAGLLRRQLRADDQIYRIGGDEFALILRHCNSRDAQRICDHVCEMVAESAFIHEGRHFKLGLSIGFTAMQAEGLSAAELARRADQACYAVKRGGRGFALEYAAAE